MGAPDGLLVVDKPAGWTSHDVVGRCRRLAATRKVGHAGTLDPMATGVLVVGIGRATRLLGHLALTTKEYQATIRLGQASITDDAEGDIVSSVDASAVTDTDVTATAGELTGRILQVPSAVSAIKVRGERSYKRVRAGEDVQLDARPVTVSRFDVQQVRHVGTCVDIDVDVECSTGTYVRALARDLGHRLGVGGHLTALRRTRVGPYGIDRAATLEQLGQVPGPEALPIVPMADVATENFASLRVEDDVVPAVRNGRALDLDLGAPGPLAVFGPDGSFLALYEQRGTAAHAVAVFAPA